MMMVSVRLVLCHLRSDELVCGVRQRGVDVVGRTVADVRASLRSLVRVTKESRAVMNDGSSVGVAKVPSRRVNISGCDGRAYMFVVMFACLVATVGSRCVRWQERRRVRESSRNFLEPGEAVHSWEPCESCGGLGSGLVQMTGEEWCPCGFLATTWR